MNARWAHIERLCAQFNARLYYGPEVAQYRPDDPRSPKMMYKGASYEAPDFAADIVRRLVGVPPHQKDKLADELYYPSVLHEIGHIVDPRMVGDPHKGYWLGIPVHGDEVFRQEVDAWEWALAQASEVGLWSEGCHATLVFCLSSYLNMGKDGVPRFTLPLAEKMYQQLAEKSQKAVDTCTQLALQ